MKLPDQKRQRPPGRAGADENDVAQADGLVQANDTPTGLLGQYLLLRNAAVDRRLTRAALAVLAVICDHRNRDSGEAFPGFIKLAQRTGLHKASVARAVELIEAAGYVTVIRNANRANVYQLALPDSREWPSGSTNATGSTDATGSNPAPDQSHPCTEPVASLHQTGSTSATRTGYITGCRTDQEQQAADAEAPATVHPALASPESEELQQDQGPAKRRGKPRSTALTYDQWIASIPVGQDCIPPDHAINRWLEEAKIPYDFAFLAWREFGSRHEGNPKKQKDWPGTFFNYLRNGWIKFWFFADGECRLNAAGEAAANVYGAEIQGSRQNRKPPIADNYANKVYVGSTDEELPEHLRPKPDRSAVGQVEAAIADRKRRESLGERVARNCTEFLDKSRRRESVSARVKRLADEADARDRARERLTVMADGIVICEPSEREIKAAVAAEDAVDIWLGGRP
jgi:hypothetical protein